MSAPLMSGMSLTEALEGGGVRLLPSDDGASSLNFRQLQAGLANAGLSVDAPFPQGTSGVFNATMAAVPGREAPPQAVASAPGLAPSRKMVL